MLKNPGHGQEDKNMEIGELLPKDQIYNALCGIGDIPLFAKYSILAIIHDRRYPEEQSVVGGALPKSTILTTENLVESAFRARPEIAERVIDAWINEVERDIQRET